MNGWAKGLWSIFVIILPLVFVIILPLVGVLVYLITHGGSMAQRNIDNHRMRDDAFRAYVRDAAGSGGTASELAMLADLRNNGVLTDAEFEAQKAKILAN